LAEHVRSGAGARRNAGCSRYSTCRSSGISIGTLMIALATNSPLASRLLLPPAPGRLRGFSNLTVVRLNPPFRPVT
jgi:hypothetical protein